MPIRPAVELDLRPDRATLSYCQRAREAFKGVPVIAGGVEASLRRLAHYDYWSDKVRKSILLDSKADLVVFGMGENAIVEMAQRLQAGETVKDLRDMRGVAYALGASETPPEDALTLPSYEEVVADKLQFAEATRIIHNETNPYNARALVQWHGHQAVVVNPPQLPISEAGHGSHLWLALHASGPPQLPGADSRLRDDQGFRHHHARLLWWLHVLFHHRPPRSSDSIAEQGTASLARSRSWPKTRHFKGTVSDIGGPTANMYQMKCTKPEVEAVCRRQSCVHPKICKLLGVDHQPVIELMREAAKCRRR